MFQFLAILVLLWLIWLIFGKQIQGWIARLLMRRLTRMAARQAGIDPDLFTGKTASASSGERGRQRNRDNTDSQRRRRPDRHTGPLIPKEYAEDVEFTEIHSYSSETEITGEGGRQQSRSSRSSFFRKGNTTEESQVSDAEIIEITRE